MPTVNTKDFNLTEDVLSSQKTKVYGLWSDSPLDANTAGESVLTSFYTSSAETGSWDSNYFWNIYQENPDSVNLNASPQFSIAFASSHSIELINSDDQLKYTYPSQGIYRQFVNSLTNLNSDGKLQYTSAGTAYNMQYAYIISIARERIRDSVDVGTWEINLGASAGVTRSMVCGPQVSGMPYYEIYSGSYNYTTGVTVYEHASASYGRFYPENGVFVFDCERLHSISAPAFSAPSTTYSATTFLTPFYQSLKTAAEFYARSKEDSQTSFYFVRIKNMEFNSTENLTWSSGSSVRDAIVDDPRVYITSIGLYDSTAGGPPLAVAKLSSPLLKTPESEALIRIRLSW